MEYAPGSPDDSQQPDPMLNPLPLVMDRSVSITATFTARPTLHLTGCATPLSGQWLDLQVSGEWDARYRLEQSTDLHDWNDAGNGTNTFGNSDWLLAPTPEHSRFFRVRSLP